jgi:hypothetical protein
MIKHFGLISFLMVAAAGCGGDDGKKNTDAAPTADACANCGTPDAAPPAPVKVVAIFDNKLEANVPVVFQRADDTVISTKMTDANGEATEIVPAGGSVSIVRQPVGGAGQAQNSVHTFMGVQPGDVLPTGVVSKKPRTISISVTMPNGGGGSTFDLLNSCGDIVSGTQTGRTGPVLTVNIDAACANANFFVTAKNGNGGELGQFYKTNVAIPAANGNINFAAETLKLGKAVNIALTNMPAGVSFARLQLPLFDGKLTMAQPGSAFGVEVPPATVNGTTLIGDTGAPEMIATLVVDRAIDTLRVVDRTVPGNYSLDINTVLVPSIVTAPAITDGVSIRWTETNEGQADGLFAQLTVRRPNPAFQFIRLLVAPHAVGAVKLPILPTMFDKFNVQTEDTRGVQGLFLLRSSLGYDNLRQNLLAGFSTESADGIIPPGAKLSIAQVSPR